MAVSSTNGAINNRKINPTRKSCKFQKQLCTVFTTYSSEEYDRRSIRSSYNAVEVMQELNTFKESMEVHPDSVKYTKYYRVLPAFEEESVGLNYYALFSDVLEDLGSLSNSWKFTMAAVFVLLSIPALSRFES